jgi:hypothetical protein
MDRWFRRGLQPENSCVLCSQELELVDHLMVQCVFSREVKSGALLHSLVGGGSEEAGSEGPHESILFASDSGSMDYLVAKK